ncbi:hypothetical protein MMC17_005901 [Xylographa soralifera]|nr:hypothetical protein [Xylographa soralifera]
MNPTYGQIPPTQRFQQLIFQYICSFNGTIGMKKLETMALAQLQQTAAGNLPLPMMRTIVQQAIEEYKQLRRSTHPRSMMAPLTTNQAPPYYQPPPQHAPTGYHPQHHQQTPAYPSGPFPPNPAVGGSAPLTSQHQYAPAHPPGLSPPNSSAEGNPPLASSQHQPAPPLLTPPTTPTTPNVSYRDPPMPSRPAAVMALVQDSDPIPAPSRPITADGGLHGHMPSRSPFSAIQYEGNPRVPNLPLMNHFTPAQRVFNPVGGPRGRPGP